MISDLCNWTPRQRPERKTLEGRFVRLEPLDVTRHGEGLFQASRAADADSRFRYLFEGPPRSREEFGGWVERVAASADPMFYAVIDRQSGEVGGRQALMRIDPAHGAIEIGNIYWGPAIARRPAATEALFLFADHVFGELGYRRFEWKCNNLNEPSKRAAERFGFRFEGVFRQHMVVKGENRDTAWFSILDKEWPALRAAYQEWLSPANFNDDGQQLRRLEEIRASMGA